VRFRGGFLVPRVFTVKDEKLRYQLEQAMIKFLKSNAVINKQASENFDVRMNRGGTDHDL
jgi:hypothetical protein